MKRRKYADGGLVVSRGYDAGLGNIRLVDTPDVSLAPSSRASMAADSMAANDAVSSRPSMKELQDANLRAVRAREARETAASPRRRPAVAPASTPANAVQTEKSLRPQTKAVAKKTADVPTPRVGIENLGRKIPAIGRYLDKVGKERASARAANQAKVEEYLRQGRPGMARMYAAIAEGADLDAAKKKLNMKNGGSVKKADAMKKMPAKAAPKKATPMAAMMAKKPAAKMAYGGSACAPKGKKK